MSNLSKLEFVALEISGNNYLSWTLDAKTHLEAKSLEETVIDGNKTSLQEKAKAMAFLRHHLDEDLKREYHTVEDPLELCKNIQERFDHLKLVLLSKTHCEWAHLRLRDHKTVSEYNSALFRITSKFKLCGEQITDKDIRNMYTSSSRAIIGDECLVDSGSTNTILKDMKIFSELSPAETPIGTISGVSNLIEGSGRAHIILSSGTQLTIDNALFSSKSRRNLLSFKDI
ncbi:uncharacterized protein LOC110882725 [Helianthus annuus]|uniref:uncharacterized protein LOC110882725 n=1 Tax=Helianthus annuus TaxID=4232 RepID=UPI000B8F7D6D|nr:uncharacterized protein LOC110882725 [Helianthus annuus]